MMVASIDPVSGPASHGEDKALESDQDEINQPEGGGEENESQSSDDDENQTTQTPESLSDAPGRAENDVQKLEKLMQDLGLYNATDEAEGQIPTCEGCDPQAPTDDHGSSDGDLHTTTFKLNDYNCHSPPRFLFRTVYPDIHSINEPDGSVIARNQSPKMDDLDGFKYTVKDHFDWRLPKPSPYMSTFSTLPALQDWAIMIAYYSKKYNKGYGEAEIRLLMIDTRRLSDECIFDAEQIATRFKIVTTNPRNGSIIDHADEFLVKGRIDVKAIVAEGTLEEYDNFAREVERIVADNEDN